MNQIRKEVILARIIETTRAVVFAEREFKDAKEVFDRAEQVRKAAKDARADATTALFDLIVEEIEELL
jgi:hypothetical protein